MSTLTLYELGEEQTALDALYAMDEGEVTPESEALEAELVAKLVAKADSFGAYVRGKEATVDAISAEIERLTARKRTLTNQVESLKRYGGMALDARQRPKIEGQLFTLALQNNPPKVEITVPVEALPLAYVRTIPEKREPDKTALRDALKDGAVIDGCTLVHSRSLRIR